MFFKVVLLSAILFATSLATVPTGCVTIKHIGTGTYLKAGDKFDPERRYVVPSYDDEWMIEEENGRYRIRNRRLNEEMYAAERCFDLERRVVYTWASGDSGSQGTWELKEYGNGYLIRNMNYDELLYAGSGIYDGWIFTWRYHSPKIDGSFLWKIESCKKED